MPVFFLAVFLQPYYNESRKAGTAMKLTKMHGLGNDYLYHYGELKDVEKWSVKLSERHFGIGSDGIILILPSEAADFKMRIFNADGSEAKMCGNGIRCVGKYVYDHGYTNKTTLTVDTLSGVRTLELHVQQSKVESVAVDMGEAIVSEEVPLTALGQEHKCHPVSVGNPHCILFVENAEEAPLTTVGPALEKHSFFSDGVNVEFVEILSEHSVRMRVWERGSGITMACGTGACASAAAAVKAGFCQSPVEVVLDGGSLFIELEDGKVKMTGPATKVCDCIVE